MTRSERIRAHRLGLVQFISGGNLAQRQVHFGIASALGADEYAIGEEVAMPFLSSTGR
jgi:hypothetical protein